MKFAVFAVIEIPNVEAGLWARIHTKLENFKLSSTIIDPIAKVERVLPGHTFCFQTEAESNHDAAKKAVEIIQAVLQSEAVEQQDCQILVLAGADIDVVLSH